MRRRDLLARLPALAGLAALPYLLGCAQARPVVVGMHPWIGYETLALAREFGWLPERVQLREGRTAGDSMAALQSGEADAACLTLDETLRGRGAGMPLAIALVFDVSEGADVVLARSMIREPQDLAGKRIGCERNAAGALVLHRFAEAAGLSVMHLDVVDIPVEQHLDAWREGRVDAIVTYEPTAELLRREGARDVFDSRRMPDQIFDVLAVRTDRIVGRDSTLRALAACHFRALAHLRTHRQDAIYRIAARQSVTPAEVQHALAGVTQPSLEANREYLSANDGRLARAAKTLGNLMVHIELLDRPDNLAGLIVPDWLPAEV